ncbi:MAG: GTPase HflX [Deltaproteobacteria bacterium]|nr:GTPase HflX [Deltaproteobacteria bacterium]
MEPKNKLESVHLVGIRHQKESSEEAWESFFELESLVYTAGAKVMGTSFQEIKKQEPSTFLGSGKVKEIAETLKNNPVDTVIVDTELSPRQSKNLEETWECKVIDRPGLILDIFAQHAKSREGKLQVELAQYLYLMPRMVGRWGHFGKLGGGIGTRGPGETQLEVDRRRARERINRIRQALKEVEKSRKIHRHKREGVPLPTVAMVGYTNAGKSSLLNALTDAGVLAEDKLFATLDPKVKRLKLPSGREILLSDTVGFIRRLPHSLVEAFKATFEEIRAADLILHVMDGANPRLRQQKEVVEKVLEELGLSNKPRLEVFNKVDLLNPSARDQEGLWISARQGIGLEKLLQALEEKLNENMKLYKVQLPFEKSGEISWIYRVGDVQSRKDREDGIHLKVYLSAMNEAKLRNQSSIKVKSL